MKLDLRPKLASTMVMTATARLPEHMRNEARKPAIQIEALKNANGTTANEVFAILAARRSY